MKKHTEKTPIDDLFARKLSNMSLSPNPDGFDRLQAKMGRSKPEIRIGVWRNPAIQRYIAIAACLLLVCVFGWLYWPTDQSTTPLAANPPALSSPQNSAQESAENAQSTSLPAVKTPDLQNQQQMVEQVAVHSKSSGTARANSNLKSFNQDKSFATSPTFGNELATAKQSEAKPEPIKPDVVTSVSQPTEQLAENTPAVKPIQAVERGLVVTISEPEALVAARQAVKTDADEKSAIAVATKPEPETKGTTLWQQVKRIKQGDVFARGNNSDAETSLIGRAYNGLKHNFDKDKSAKQ